MLKSFAFVAGILLAVSQLLPVNSANESGDLKPLFPDDSIPKGWVVRHWADVKNPGPDGAVWRVEHGVLRGSEPRGTWLVSEKEYGDFIIEFEFKLGERGNSGFGFRFPEGGDPAFDGIELQMVAPKYYPPEMTVPPEELTGGLYRAVAPREQLFKPMEWNRYQVECRGPRIRVQLNGRQILDVNLDDHDEVITRHNGQDAPPLKDRPRKGRIGFQELSREGGPVEIRNARFRELSSLDELRVIEPGEDGTVLLHARDAQVHGSRLRYEPEPHKNTLGFWTNPNDWASWRFLVRQPGTFRVEALQGCGPGSGGSEVEFRAGSQAHRMIVQETKHFQDFLAREVGSFTFESPGIYTLSVRPLSKPGLAVMDLRQVRLIPSGRE